MPFEKSCKSLLEYVYVFEHLPISQDLQELDQVGEQENGFDGCTWAARAEGKQEKVHILRFIFQGGF